MIKINKATLEISEFDLRRILKMVDDYRTKNPNICTDPMGDGDMDTDTHRLERKKRGYLRIDVGSQLCIEITRSEVKSMQECETLWLR